MRRLACLAASAGLLAGCGGISLPSLPNLNPFSSSGPAEVRRDMGGAIEYRCDGGRRFWTRPIDATATWVVLPDRELRLPRLGAEGSGRFGAGRVVLELSGSTAKLADPPTNYENCRQPSAEEKKK